SPEVGQIEFDLSTGGKARALHSINGMKCRGPLLVSVLVLFTAGCHRIHREAFAPAIERFTSSTPAWVPGTELARKLWSSEQRFYRERGHLPAWIDGDRPTPQFDALLQAAGAADTHGLDSRAYGLAALRTARAGTDRGRFRRRAFERERVPELDLRATYAFLTYAAD